MFCPNCGTQNPDAAQTCSKCNFHLKSAAAPKFKGTMLMMNQPGALPGVPAAPGPSPARPAPAAVPPPGAGAVPSKLKGTMVGVAPMAGGGGPIPPPITAPMVASPAPPGLSPMPPPPVPAHGEGASAFSPPVPQPGVNPLGGTVAADAGVFGAFAAHQQQGPSAGGPPGYGAPPPQPGFPPPFGVPPPPGMPGSPPPYGAPPAPYGAPDPYGQSAPGAGYGVHAPTQGAVGPGGQAMIPYPQPPSPMIGTLKSQGAGAAGPTRRNALLTLLLPVAVMFGGIILSVLLGALISWSLASLGTLFVLGGGVWSLLLAIQMVNELKAVTRSDQLAWWGLLVPVYNMFFMWFVVPQEVAKAKQQLGARQPPQNIILYIFLWPFALASDLNDLVR